MTGRRVLPAGSFAPVILADSGRALKRSTEDTGWTWVIAGPPLAWRSPHWMRRATFAQPR
jgi:hypothetical protein